MKIYKEMFNLLARTFPICCASDEFYYFPQVRLPKTDWGVWDSFCPDTVNWIVRKLSEWEDKLGKLSESVGAQGIHGKTPSTYEGLSRQIDSSSLISFSKTLREQLSEVRTWQYQPTFYLTMVCMGLAEAMGAEEPDARYERAKNLPAFLDQAVANLRDVPVLFRDLGLEMVSGVRDYLIFLSQTIPALKNALKALDRFRESLLCIKTRKDFLLPPELFERIVKYHIKSNMDIDEIRQVLDLEIDEMRGILEGLSRSLTPGGKGCGISEGGWIKALRYLPLPVIGDDGLLGLYRNEVERLSRHCIENGLVSSEFVSTCPVNVLPMPEYLSGIRTAPSYSIAPLYPPSGGKFYIIDKYDEDTKHGHKFLAGDVTRRMLEYHREYRMLIAHETYPGHHLLDSSRWGLANFCRRVIERPIFYEGWACFGEELMRQTGYFFNAADTFMLARRRLWRAVRGRVDIALQTGETGIREAAVYLAETGISKGQAIFCARKYPLNSGYQLSYTLGLRRFMGLFDQYGTNGLTSFVKTILSQGEIDFEDLEKIVKNVDN